MDEHTLSYTLDEKKIVADFPFGLFNIELTNRCPMKCVMCPRTNHMTREQGFMDFMLFKKIIDELAGVNPDFIHNRVVWLHHFGESLLHPEFDSFIRYASEKGVRTGLSVNPVMLTEKTSYALLGSGLHILYLSMDGHDDASFYKIRGINNLYEKSHSRVTNFLKMKKEYHSPVKIILSMIDFSLNEESVASVRREWESRPEIDGFLLKNYTAWDGSVPEIRALSPKHEKENIRDSAPVNCRFPWTDMTVTWDGDVVPCCFDYNKKHVLGNANTNSLSFIWNDTPMRNLRSEFISNEVVNPLCRNCESLYSSHNSF